MVPSIVRLTFPGGSLPASGYRCPRCGEEIVAANELASAHALARRLGLFGTESKRKRRLQRTGNSVTVSLDPELLRQALDGIGPGDDVTVGRIGKRIVIEKAEG